MKILALTLLLTVAIAGIVIAQEASVTSILAAAKTAAQEYADANAVYLRNDNTTQVGSGGSCQEVIHRTILLLTPDGVTDYGNVEYDYPPSLQTVSLNYARVITMDGDVTPVPASAVRRVLVSKLKHNEIGNTVPGQIDTMALTFTPSAAGPHTILDYQLTIHWVPKATANGFSIVWYFAQTIPMWESQLQLSAPQTASFKWKSYGTYISPVAKTKSIVQTEGTTISYSFAVHNAPAILREPNMPDWYAIAPRVAVSNIPGWGQVAARMHAQFTTAETADQSVRRVTDGIIAGCKTTAAKIAAINRFMRTEVRYLPILHLTPLPAPITLAYREGDCKDQAALMIAMLKVAGVTAYPVLINPYRGGNLDFSFPYLSSPLLHVIVAVPHRNGWWFFDPSADSVYAPDYLPLGDRGKHGVLIIGQKDRLWVKVQTPVSSPDDTRVQENAECTVSRRGDLTAHVVAQLTGDKAAVIRYLWSVADHGQLINYYKGQFAGTLPKNSQLTGFQMDFGALGSGALSVNDPITVKINFTATGFVQTDSRTRWFTVPYWPLSVDPWEVVWQTRAPERRYPYITPAETINARTVVTVPSSFTVRIPDGVDITTSAGNAHAHYTVDTEDKIVIDRTLEIDKSVIPASRLGNLVNLFWMLAQDEQAKIYLVPQVKTSAH